MTLPPKLEKMRDELATDLDRLLRVVECLSEALTMYSNERNWISRQTISGRVCEEWSVIDEKYRYGHDRAKEALAAAQKILGGDMS